MWKRRKQSPPPSLSRVTEAAAPRAIPDRELYRPTFQPWHGAAFLAEIEGLSDLVTPDRLWVVRCLLQQTRRLGEVWECGVYKGGTAKFLVDSLERFGDTTTIVRLFDTFAGMPESDPARDMHGPGDFADTSAAAVAERVGREARVRIHAGWIPATFAGFEDTTIGFAHVDTDIHRSVWDCAAFVWPRLAVGGAIVFDDYGFPTCPGAREAVDEFFRATGDAVPLALHTGQAIVFKGP